MNWDEATKRYPWIRTLCERGYEDSETYLPRADAQIFEKLNEQLAQVDFDRLDRHRTALKNPELRRLSPDALKPFRFARQIRLQTINPGLAGRGEKMLSAGAVAEVILAGGAATRFFKGQDAMPKALYPISPVAGKTFLDIFLQEAVGVAHKHKIAPPVLIMLSRVTQKQMLNAMESHHRFGLPADCIFTFAQAHHPRLDSDARVIIRPDGSLVWYGDGHGGIFTALIKSGLRLRLMASGVHTLVLHNVDNPLAKPFDATRLGFHSRGHRLMTMTVYQRKKPEQKVGVVSKLAETGAVDVVEYSEADPNLMTASDNKGLLFDCGHVNTNCFELSAITDRVRPALYTDKPLVIGDKKIASSTFEVLNQHLARLLNGLRVGVFASPETECFLPTKNMEGPDSVETTRDFLSNRAFGLLRDAGAVIHGRTHTCDTSPLLDTEGVKTMFPTGKLEIFDHASVYLSPVNGTEGATFPHGLVVGKNATFMLDSLQPFGEFSIGPNRRVKQTLPPPVLKAGGQINVKKGGTLIISLSAGSVLKIPKKLVVAEGKTLKIELKRGEKRTISSIKGG